MTHPYDGLTPDRVISCVESIGLSAAIYACWPSIATRTACTRSASRMPTRSS